MTQVARLFTLGRIVATPGFLELGLTGSAVATLLSRHLAGQWEMDAEDVEENFKAIDHGWRVFGRFMVHDQPIWIITEADRSSTCLLLPSEY